MLCYVMLRYETYMEGYREVYSAVVPGELRPPCLAGVVEERTAAGGTSDSRQDELQILKPPGGRG